MDFRDTLEYEPDRDMTLYTCVVCGCPIDLNEWCTTGMCIACEMCMAEEATFKWNGFPMVQKHWVEVD